MAADLSVHVFEGITENDLAVFNSNTLGSRYFGGFRSVGNWDDSCAKISKTPSVWIGEVSWLKAALADDAETYIPDPVAKISELIGEDLPVLDDELMAAILAALELPNSTGYGVAQKSDVELFLDEHKGKRVFTVSW